MKSLGYEYERPRKFQMNNGEKQWLEIETLSVSIMSIISDEILLEILLRVSDFRRLVECASVCKRWYSIIFSFHDYFKHRFIHYHHQKRLNNSPTSPSPSRSLPFTLLFRNSCDVAEDLQNVSKVSSFSFDYFSERSKIFHYGEKSALECMRWCDIKGGDAYDYIWSSFDDLLLVERSLRKLYVCNPFTKQHIAIPISPNATHKLYRYALGVLRDFDEPIIKYKVVKVSTKENDVEYLESSYLIHLAIFCSETGQWSHSSFKSPVALNRWHFQTNAVGNNGVVYWPYGSWTNGGIIALNPYLELSYLIKLPLLLGCKGCLSDCNLNSKVHVGVVRGKLRIAQFNWCKSTHLYEFMAWELVDKDEVRSWNLVHYHDEMMMGFQCGSVNSLPFTMIAFHSDDGNVFFFQRFNDNLTSNNIEIFQCRILGKNRIHIEFLCRLPPTSPMNTRVVSLIHPAWPTQIPYLRRHHQSSNNME
ncbi:hypothetical protein G4B88_004641 [Cannabis sativa]|uniref:F-box domain-containing protein n=1 Tax=Cannabis sativa TaxID=3483 RepID=A0A7J6G508_CANSA|nr:hypothetical protein G4B88_004641 [Cannabis sativa]